MSVKSKYIPQGIRNDVTKRDRGVCQHCGQRAATAKISPRGALQFFDDDGQVFHLDHLIPLSRGGDHSVDNLVLACASCNQGRRHTMTANDPEVQAILTEFS